MIRLSIFLFSFLIITSCHSDNVETLLSRCMTDYNGIGAAVGFIKNGKITYYCQGKKSLQENTPIDEHTIFEIGSISKVFTTWALMDMASEELVQLDDPVVLYLPELEIDKKTTLRQLATHTSGLPRLPDNFKPKDPNNPYIDYRPEHLGSFENSPGIQFEYSNLGMGLLGHALSTFKGQSYEEMVCNLCKKLGMDNTFITHKMIDCFAIGHNGGKEVSYWDFDCLQGAGAIRSNIKDMTLFLQANMGMIPSDILKLCHEQQVQAAPDLGVGFGWMISNDIIWHNGATGGFRSFLGFNPKTQRGVVILTNSAEDWPDEFGFSVLDQNFAANEKYLVSFVGSYVATLEKDRSKQEMFIYLLGTQLRCVASGWEMAILSPESHGVFSIRGLPDATVQVKYDTHGNIKKITATVSGSIVWEAVPAES